LLSLGPGRYPRKGNPSACPDLPVKRRRWKRRSGPPPAVALESCCATRRRVTPVARRHPCEHFQSPGDARADRGPRHRNGIPPEVLPKIFDASTRGDANITRQFGGMGTGILSIRPRALVEMHQGTIRAETGGRGRGSTFTVELPLSSGRPRNSRPGGATLHSPDDNGAKPNSASWSSEDHRGHRRSTSAGCFRASAIFREGRRTVPPPRPRTRRRPSHAEVIVSDIGLPDRTGYDLMKGDQIALCDERDRHRAAMHGRRCCAGSRESRLQRPHRQARQPQHSLERSIRRVAGVVRDKICSAAPPSLRNTSGLAAFAPDEAVAGKVRQQIIDRHAPGSGTGVKSK